MRKGIKHYHIVASVMLVLTLAFAVLGFIYEVVAFSLISIVLMILFATVEFIKEG